jgi:hypothetical protein
VVCNAVRPSLMVAWQQRLYAADPGNWHVTANMPAGNTAVVSYPSIAVNYGQITNVPTPLTRYSSIYSSFSEDMNATAKTSAWAAYDIWLGRDGCSSCASHEVMIQHDFAGNGPCATLATVSLGGSGGVPVRNWNLCKYGSEIIWKLAHGNEQTGRVDILSTLSSSVSPARHRRSRAVSGLGHREAST